MTKMYNQQVKVFPIGPDNKQEKLFRDIIQVLVNYRSDKHADIMAHQYAVEIMRLFDEFANGTTSECTMSTSAEDCEFCKDKF